MTSLLTVDTDTGYSCPTASAAAVTTSRNNLNRDICLSPCRTILDVLKALFLKLFLYTTAALPPLTSGSLVPVINVTGFQVETNLVLYPLRWLLSSWL